jgi:magnesium transporter
MNIQKSLVYFVTSLKANDIILEKLSNGSVLSLYAEDVDLLEDAMIESRQGIETANIYREIVARISDTYATVISNNLNGIMKFLAGITIVSTIPTMIASFMGMNVPLGSISTNEYALYIVIAVSLILAVLIAIILKKKDMM